MISFICKSRPLSVNAKRTQRFREEIRRAFQESCGSQTLEEGFLYGAVYYFHNEPRSLDADNLSKPVWDALKGLPYVDDSRIRLRHAGVADLREIELTSFDLTDVPTTVANMLLSSIGSEPHLVYIELGLLQPHMYKFGLSKL